MQNSTIKASQATIDIAWNFILVFAVAIIANLMPDIALAATGNNAISTALCNVVQMVTGSTGKAIATIAIIVVGLGALMGKVSWGMALIVGLGVALIFGAATIVDTVSGGAGSNCSTGNVSSATR